MKILLANTPWVIENKIGGVKAGSRWPVFGETSFRNAPFPFWLAYSAALLKKDFDVSVIDAVANKHTNEKFINEVENLSPDVMVIEATTNTFHDDLRIAKILKESTGCKIVFTGPHVTALPRESLRNGCIDFVAVGEYELTLKHLIDALKNKTSLRKVDGLGFKSNKKR